MTDNTPLLNGKADLFSPKTFYNLSGAAFGVWIACLVLNTLFPSITPFHYRIIAFILAQIIAIVIVLKNAIHRKQIQYWVLSFFNAALIFTHASGYNAVTYNLSFEKGLHYDSGAVTKANLFNLNDQVNWWPDTKLIDDIKVLNKKNIDLIERNKALQNQYSYIRDWTISNISNVKDREKLLTLLSNFGKSDPELNGNDVEIRNAESEIEKINLRFSRDSALTQLQIAKLNSNPTIQIDGVILTRDEFLDSLIIETTNLRVELSQSRLRENRCLEDIMRLRNRLDSLRR